MIGEATGALTGVPPRPEAIGTRDPLRVKQLDMEPQPQPTIETIRASEQTTTNFFISIISEGKNDCGDRQGRAPFHQELKASRGCPAILLIDRKTGTRAGNIPALPGIQLYTDYRKIQWFETVFEGDFAGFFRPPP